MNQELIALVSLIQTAVPLAGSQESILAPIPAELIVQETISTKAEVLVEKSLSLDTRHPDEGVSQAFADNILLSLHYLNQDVDDFKKDREKQGPENILWDKIREPFEVNLLLKPGELFAYHDNILKNYQDRSLITGNSHFSFEDGYKAVAGLYGNGVCHLASLINWTASEGGLKVNSPVAHDFYPVPGVPQEYGTSILYWKGEGRNSTNQNLYLENNLSLPILLTFTAESQTVKLRIQKVNS